MQAIDQSIIYKLNTHLLIKVLKGTIKKKMRAHGHEYGSAYMLDIIITSDDL